MQTPETAMTLRELHCLPASFLAPNCKSLRLIFCPGRASPHPRSRFFTAEFMIGPPLVERATLRLMQGIFRQSARANIALDVYLRLTKMFVCCGPPSSV